MICTKSNCKNCEHYRYDEDYGDMACWLKVDTKNKEYEVLSNGKEKHFDRCRCRRS